MSNLKTLWLLNAAIFLSAGIYFLYRFRMLRGYVRQLPDSYGNRQIKLRHKVSFAMGFLMLLGATWNFWRVFASK